MISRFVKYVYTHLFFFYWRYNPLWVCILQPSSGAIASSRTRFLDHTQRRATVGRSPLDEWSVRRRDLYLTTHNTQQTNIHAPAGIRTHDRSRRVAADLRLRPRGFWDRHLYTYRVLTIVVISIWIGNVLLYCNHGKMSDAWGDDGLKTVHNLPSLTLAFRFSDTSNSPNRLYREGINVFFSTDIRVKRVVKWLREN